MSPGSDKHSLSWLCVKLRWLLKQSLTCNAADDQVRLASFYSCIHLKQILAEMCFGKKITYATLGKVVVESKNMLAVVEALDVVAPGGVVGAPGHYDDDVVTSYHVDGAPYNIYGLAH